MFEQKSMLKRMFCILGLVCVLFLTACGDHHSHDDNNGGYLNSDLYGTWYLNVDGGLPVKPNSNNQVSNWTFKEDGSCIDVDYFTTENEGYIQTDDDPPPTVHNGTWSCDSKVIKTKVDGITDSVAYKLSSDKKTLTVTGDYEGASETLTYKRSVPSK